MKSLILLSSLIIIINSSCSINKRVYNNGYHVNWKSLRVTESKKETITPIINSQREKIKSLINEDKTRLRKTFNYKVKEGQKSSRKKTETSFINKIPTTKKNKKEELRDIDDLSYIRNASQSKNKSQSSSDKLEELILKVLLIILILIPIGILLSLLGGLLGALFSILLFLLIIYLILKIIGLV